MRSYSLKSPAHFSSSKHVVILRHDGAVVDGGEDDCHVVLLASHDVLEPGGPGVFGEGRQEGLVSRQGPSNQCDRVGTSLHSGRVVRVTPKAVNLKTKISLSKYF